MDKKIVLGIIPEDEAETAINNLVEADYDQGDISLVMRDVKSARRIIDDGGPLPEVNQYNVSDKLAAMKIGVSSRQIYSDALAKGRAILAVCCPNEYVSTTKTMFADYNATDVIVV